jgi:hypothetical protein
MRPYEDNPYDEKWHRRVDRALFGHVDDDSGVWVDGLLQSLADSRKIEQFAARVGLPLLAIIAVGVIVTALHAPPAIVTALLRWMFGK